MGPPPPQPPPPILMAESMAVISLFKKKFVYGCYGSALMKLEKNISTALPFRRHTVPFQLQTQTPASGNFVPVLLVKDLLFITSSFFSFFYIIASKKP